MSWKLSGKLKVGSDSGLDSLSSTTSTPEPRLLPRTSSPSGILTITLHEGVGLSAPDQCQELPLGFGQKSQLPLPYALLDYDKSQVTLQSCGSKGPKNPQWYEYTATRKFNVTRAVNLTIHLYLRDSRAPKINKHLLLGVVALDLFQSTTVLGSQWLQVQQGTGRIRISLEYLPVEERVYEVDTSLFRRLNDSRDLLQLKEKDTQQQYARKSIRSAELPHISHAIVHPFVVSLAFASETQRGVEFFTPFISGGHLLNHLQRLQRFDTNKAKFYAASIVCALEYLHNTCVVIPWLKPGNILLDALGHVTLCGLSLLTVPKEGEGHFDRKFPEYPAPELLDGDSVESKSANWWTLGIVLYEMLTGLPPFYDDKMELRRYNILKQPVQFPEGMEPSVTDFLGKLLDRSPERRLGAGGASDVKAHAFFHGLDWGELIQKRHEPVFRPEYFVNIFEPNGFEDPPKPPRTLKDRLPGWTYTGPMPGELFAQARAQEAQHILESRKSKVEQGREYELVWMEATRQFHFHNPRTGTRNPVHFRKTGVMTSNMEEVLPESTMSKQPDPTQKQAALETALECGYYHAVSQLLDYGMDLNIPIVVAGAPAIPLQWVAEQGNSDLASMFLAKSTQKIDRVSATQALGLAVDRQDVPIVHALLSNGVLCDFEEWDRPPPHTGNGCVFIDPSDPEGFLAPLIRSVKCANTELALLLLKHGANANSGYHNVQWGLERLYPGERIHFTCGRAVQLAMELDQLEMVKLLIESGANINLEQPVWCVEGHRCDFVSRAVYQRVTHRLRNLSR
ncbi:kinase-like protein [Massarina eburnea CBS 473.64]|uniref:Kinase-like protein n=1 Tax=Massarina eburnea CBS 473.64 TaxID=1395130 RepID=A0A6A6RH66_9PLEO|nr:kinase-like protein [Massarina eburnea CBS 473.64]